MKKVSARGRVLAAAGAAVLALVLALVGTVVVRPWLEVREIEQRPLVVPEVVTVTPAPAAQDAPAADPARGVPVRVEITAIGVDATVVPVAMDGDGRLVPPSDVARVGWWAGGARAGTRQGSVVLTGHSVQLGDGVFDDLAELRRGDVVRVATRKGVVTYSVDEVVDYSHDQVTALAPAIFGQDVASQLTLVTCSGYVAGDYRTNTVVTAHPTRGTT